MFNKLARFFNRMSLWFTMPVLILFLLILFFSGLVIRTYNELKNFQMREAPSRATLARSGKRVQAKRGLL